MTFKYNHNSRDKGVNNSASNKDNKNLEVDRAEDSKTPKRRKRFQITCWITFDIPYK